MGVVSGLINTRAGSGSLDIGHSLLPDTTIEIGSIDSIEVDFDLSDNENTITKLFFSPGLFEFSVFDRMGNGGSMFEELNDIPVDDRIVVDLSFTTDGGHSFDSAYVFDKSDVEYDILERKLTIESRIPPSDILVSDIFTANPGDVVTSDVSPDTMFVSDFIENYFNLFDPGNTNIIQTHNFRATQATVADDDRVFLVMDDATTLASDVIYKIAAADASIVGSFWGYNFMVGRLNADNDVVITTDDAETLGMRMGIRDFFEAEISIQGSVVNTSSLPRSFFYHAIETDRVGVYGLNENGTKKLDVYFEFDRCFEFQYDSATDSYAAFNSDTEFIVNEMDEGEDIAVLSPGAGLGQSFYFYTAAKGGSSLEFVGDAGVTHIITEIDSNEYHFFPPAPRDIRSNNSFSPRIVLETPFDANNPYATNFPFNAYKKSLGADGENIISLNIFDVDTLNPYQTFTLDSSYPSTIANQKFRPSKLTYNLESDTIEVEAYQIN